MSLWRSCAHPLRHPDLLPTFRAGVAGLSLALAAVEGVLGEGSMARSLAPLLFGLAVLLPLPAVLSVGGTLLGVLVPLVLAREPGAVARTSLALGGAGVLGIGMRRLLLSIEWQLTSRKVLGALLVAGRSARPQEALREVLALVREAGGASTILALRQLDEVAADTLVALPDTGLAETLTSPRLFAEAHAQQRCLFHADYARAPGASPFVVARGVRSLALLPLRWQGQGPEGTSRGAILLAWQRRVRLHVHARHFLEQLRDELGALLQLTETTQQLERLQARYGAILGTMPQGVVFVEASGEQGWVNHVAAELLGVPAGPNGPATIAQAMAGLRARASNPEEIARQGAQLLTDAQATIRDWLWTFEQPREQALSLSSTPTRLRDVPGRLWLLDDITEAWQAQRARRQAEEALHVEREKTERLLLNILPQAIARRLKQEDHTIADGFAEATILFADLVDFTLLAARIPPTEVVYLLNELFSAFDQLTEKHGLEKIKTIGDAYMVAGGLPMPDPNHVSAIAEMALDMMRFVQQFNARQGVKLNLRTGIHTGPVVAGVIGTKRFTYDLWGDTVNTASRMESHGLPGHIHVTRATYERLRDKYVFIERGRIPIKGKGEMTTYLLEGRKH
jgi:class 3 adenylate cyclase